MVIRRTAWLAARSHDYISNRGMLFAIKAAQRTCGMRLGLRVQLKLGSEYALNASDLQQSARSGELTVNRRRHGERSGQSLLFELLIFPSSVRAVRRNSAPKHQRPGSATSNLKRSGVLTFLTPWLRHAVTGRSRPSALKARRCKQTFYGPERSLLQAAGRSLIQVATGGTQELSQISRTQSRYLRCPFEISMVGGQASEILCSVFRLPSLRKQGLMDKRARAMEGNSRECAGLTDGPLVRGRARWHADFGVDWTE